MDPHHIQDVLFKPDVINRRVNSLVEEIAENCRADHFVMIGILRGSFVFLADLIRELYRHDIHPRIGFISLESYGGDTVSSGTIHITKDISINVKGAHVLLVDDILDTGKTLSKISKKLWSMKPASLKNCILLNKRARRSVDIKADFVGFEIPNEFVVGYGLDFAESYRHLPYIGVLKKEITQN